MAGHKKAKYPFRSISLKAYSDGPELVHYGVLDFTEDYLKPECEILEYDKAKWHIKVRWVNPEHTGSEISEANSQGDFENILICMNLE
jgi:hypothetical protein